MRKLGVAGPVLLGALATFAATRFLPPVIARSVGTARGYAGDDPFEELVQDHQRIADVLKRMDSGATTRMERHWLTLQAKRRLTEHALAEENAVYPLLDTDDIRLPLYAEHANMKILLHSLEHEVDDKDRWAEHAAALRTVVTEHVREEEDELFPRLRAKLAEPETALLLGEIEREKAMVL
jgi:hemerythrin superfamily protein